MTFCGELDAAALDALLVLGRRGLDGGCGAFFVGRAAVSWAHGAGILDGSEPDECCCGDSYCGRDDDGSLVLTSLHDFAPSGFIIQDGALNGIRQAL